MTRRKSLLGPKRRRRLPPYTVLRCPMVGHQASWCRGLCRPLDGHGICGRLAPHAMLDRTQRAILRYKLAQEAARQASG
ncbi:MAG: hypothetical protein JRI23_24255 [Deltaproteobacteria bacterium]|nr:hypothetical protein [Deltaproteobacteria bacterium]MBW2535111.1 hypothetical protein [Deltaproteobacteria bacterium]